MKLTIDYLEEESLVLLKVDEISTAWFDIQRLIFEASGDEAISRGKSTVFPWWRFLALKSDLRYLFNKYDLQITLSDKVKILLRRSLEQENSYRTVTAKKTLIDQESLKALLIESGFKRNLTINQLNNVQKLYNFPAAATFSVPGAGKTTEALAFYALNRTTDMKLLIIAPKNAFIAWDDEIRECMDNTNKICRLTGGYAKIDGLLNNKPEMSIITYQQVPTVLPLLAKFLNSNKTSIFLDESHRIKKGALGTIGSSILSLAPLAWYKLIMSGTPMPNSTNDLIPQFRFLYPEMSCSEENIGERFQPIFVRTTKKELNLDHNRRFSITQVDMNPNQRSLYDLMRSEQLRVAHQYLKSKDRNVLRQIGRSVIRMLQVASNPRLLAQCDFAYHDLLQSAIREGDSPKIEYVCNRANLLAKEGKKVVIWSSFVENIEVLNSRLSNLGAVFIHGQVDSGDETNPDTREGKIRRFHNDDSCFVLIANPAAASEGISLHKVCHHALYLDRNYNAAQYLQSIDRIHRLGLAPDTISHIEIVSCNDSIDEMVHSRLNTKIEAMESVLNDDSINAEYEYFDDEFTQIESNSLSDQDIETFIHDLIDQGGED